MSENHWKSHNVNDSDVNRWENFVNTAYIIFYYKLLPTSIYIYTTNLWICSPSLNH